MKSTIRTFAIALALTAVAASAHFSPIARRADASVGASKMSAMPIPTCPPDDPNGCGIQR